ncbi:membrane-associating domain-containing [Fusarium albosuccineum]|uniref:Membrane-associating domain-containing n=1 Tax=Fusarium albosuccineum TaxID=1237068 RepID=A0A8H4P8I9_9HYPO|nr:membrane-associating domain-containing [Fusarium albosuccineum]
MGASSGVGLKFFQWFIRGIQFACAALILAVYSYFLATLNNHNLSVSTTIRAVEGISGVAVLYTAAGLVLLCCLAGRTFSSFLAVVLDFAFVGAFIYVAVANKDGAGDCNGYLDTPFGSGKAGDTASGSDGFTALPSYRVACRLQSACLAVAIIAIFFFVFSILMEVALARHHRKEKRFGPSPANNYTSGYGKKGGFFGRLFRRKTAATEAGHDLPEHTHPDQLNDDFRQSHATERTAVNNYAEDTAYNKYDNNGFSYQDTNYGRQDGYGQIHYPEPEQGVAQPSHNNPNYRYEDGVYDRA